MELNDKKIAIIGLGYVGLPLAVEFAKKYPVIGFDINMARIAELSDGNDRTFEVGKDDLRSSLASSFNDIDNNSNGLWFTSDKSELGNCNIYIVTVPTPTDKHNRPVLTPLIRASETIGGILKKGDIVIYESTVYPGVTEDECVPVLEKVSGLTFNVDFFAGYSPERINPGDKEHTVTKILKVTSGSTEETAVTVDELYKSVIQAGTHKASSIKVAEAAKVIENAQRDINIAFVNELAKIFNLLGIDTNEVLEAAGTKWNFLKFRPGLVGGHCIGVDPYYLAQKAQEVGYHSEIILAGRRLNDSMGGYVADEVIKLMLKKGLQVVNSKTLVLGFTFKENCPDVRNTRVIDIIKKLESYNINVTTFDPWADPEEVAKEYGIKTVNTLEEVVKDKYDSIILAVAHKEFQELDLKQLTIPNAVIFDVKGSLDIKITDGRL